MEMHFIGDRRLSNIRLPVSLPELKTAFVRGLTYFLSKSRIPLAVKGKYKGPAFSCGDGLHRGLYLQGVVSLYRLNRRAIKCISAPIDQRQKNGQLIFGVGDPAGR